MGANALCYDPQHAVHSTPFLSISASFFDFSVFDDYYFASDKIAEENSLSGATHVF